MIQLGHANHPRREIMGEIAWAAENGFDFLDLFLEPECGALEVIDPPAIRRELADRGLGVVGHLSPALPIGSALPQMRRAAVQTADDYLAAFAEVGVPVVTIHGNWPPGLFSAAEGVAWQVESLRELVALAKRRGIAMMYENVPSRAGTIEAVSAVLDQVPGLLCHLDLGHTHISDTPSDIWIRHFADRLVHVHLHDNNGLADQHLPPGAGTIDWPEVVRALRDIGYDKTITIEVFSPDRNLLLFARDRVRQWFPKTDQ